MLLNRLTFFLGIFGILLAATLCFPRHTTAQFLETSQLISLPIETFGPNGFVVYGKTEAQEDAGIVSTVRYQQTTEPLPDLDLFFEFGGTLELVTTTLFLTKSDIVISEIMWGVDKGLRSTATDPTAPQQAQWIELYNTHTAAQITVPLFFLFTPFESYPDRDIVEFPNGELVRVLDTVSNLHLGKWRLPGKSGRRPTTTYVSAYRDITYPDTANGTQTQAIVPFGSYPESWKATPDLGRRNTLLITIDGTRLVEIPYIATPGREHVPETLVGKPPTTAVDANKVVINEVRNDLSKANLDWIELKNISRSAVDLENWEVSIVTGVGEDTDLADLPDYQLPPGEILLLQAKHPKFTALADGINIGNPTQIARGAVHKYVIVPGLHLPNTGQFLLLLRSEPDQNGQDAAIEDYAGNGFFPDNSSEFNTEFWPRKGQRHPTDVANFGNYTTFGALDSAWARRRYNEGDGHHKDAWARVGTQGGVGYAPKADRSRSPGTPGYENTALKTQADDKDTRTPTTDNEYNDGEISISEIMSDASPRQNTAQWIELYNSSLTQAVNLEGWELEIRNAEEGEALSVNSSFIFNEVIILPNQTLLLVSKRAPHNLLDNRIYNVLHQHRQVLNLFDRRHLLSPTGFYLKLSYKPDPERPDDAVVVDEVGNLKVEGNMLTKVWDLPVPDPEQRQSLVRQYGDLFKPNQGSPNGEPEPARDGMTEESWRQANTHLGITYYGHSEDRGNPGYRLGGPLPVQLSSFRPERTATGAVVITWTTESELNNAGFNLLRSKQRDAVFVPINPALLLGAGTSGEKHTYRFTDTTAKPNIAYYYQIEDVSFAGTRRTLVTVRLKGHVSATDKLTTTWGILKTQD